MRITRVLVVTALIALFAAPSFATVCHPRQPVTCRAASLTRPAVAETTPAPATKKVKAVKANTPAKSQQAKACGPWIRFACKAQTLA